MNRLYAPWRTNYITHNKDDKKCVFCDIVEKIDNDNEFKVLYRNKDFFVVMNKYPYSPGHFMIIPNMHTDKLEDLDPKVWSKISLASQQGVRLLKDVLNSKGINIGMNLGKAGGAGISDHIHLHIVPRWIGDTNFITTISNTRVYSSDFEQIYNLLKQKAYKYFDNIY